MAPVDRRGPGTGADDLTRLPVSVMQEIQQRRQHDHVAEPAKVDDGWSQRVSEHHVLNTASRGIWSTRVTCGGPPRPNTPETRERRGNRPRCDSAPNRTTSGKPNAAAA